MDRYSIWDGIRLKDGVYNFLGSFSKLRFQVGRIGREVIIADSYRVFCHTLKHGKTCVFVGA